MPIPEICDLFLFSGQSNMAGRGIVTKAHGQEAPAVPHGVGYEFRAVSDPNQLHRIAEPFGLRENRPEGIDDGTRKTGSMVSAFVNACYERTGIPIVAVSASKGDSSISEWQPDTPYFRDVVWRMHSAVCFLREHGCTIRHCFLAWCQGEKDAQNGKNIQQYRMELEHFWNQLRVEGMEKCFLISIGLHNSDMPWNFRGIIEAQERLAKDNQNVIMASRKFREMKARGLMIDAVHYVQQAYNEVGADAGAVAGANIAQMIS